MVKKENLIVNPEKLNGLCNLNNVIYRAMIYPKENITDK